MPRSDSDALILEFKRRLLAIADKPPYRYVNTSAKDRTKHEAKKRSFTGYTDQEIAAAESALNVRFPEVFRAYLEIMGVTRGDLFCGSSVASLNELSEHRKFAEELLAKGEADWELDDNAVVFLEHQGYTFCYFVADGGIDTPIYQYVEGEKSPSQSAPSFADMVDAEIATAEEVNRKTREAGGYFLTVEDGFVSQRHPSIASGVRPLDLPDGPDRPWWRFW